jgi:predicted dehydrogenase
MPRLRTAILGCGNIAHRHAQNLVALEDDVELVAFCNRTVEKALAFSEQYTGGNGAVFAEHHAMFDTVDLDLVVICLPPYAHSDEVELAAERGVHIFIEKPIALTSEQGWRMVEATAEPEIKTQVGFMYRFGEAVEFLKALLDDGTVGAAGLMSGRYFCNALHASWWRMRQKSGGQLVEQVIHLVDLMRYLLGEPESVYSRQANLFHRHLSDYTVEDVSATVIAFKSGALGVICATNGAIPGRWINDYHVVAQNLTAEFSDANHATFHFTAEPERPPQIISAETDYHQAEMLDLLNAIRTNGQTRTPIREGALSLDLALSAARSADRGLPVEM